MSKKPNIYFNNREIILTGIFIVFGIVFSLISIPNHYLFRTAANDLGMYNHAVYSYSHLKPAVFTLTMYGKEFPFLAGHFSLITILYSPFYYLFGSYTLLIIQIAAILFGGLGIYKYSLNYFDKDSYIPHLILIHFFSIYGIYSALSFDFHNNVAGAMLIPWFVYYLEKRKTIPLIIITVLIVSTKEIMAVWLFFLILMLMVKNRKQFAKSYLKLEIPLLFFTLAYAYVVIFIIVPHLQGMESNMQFSRYSLLGDTPTAILHKVFTQPLSIIKSLFSNTLHAPVYDNIKSETLFMLAVSGGFLILFRPVYLIFFLPVIFQKFSSDSYGFWGINAHYSIEFVPLLSLLVIDSIKGLRHRKVIAYALISIIAIATMKKNIDKINHRESKWYNKVNTVFYEKEHYNTAFDIKQMNNALKLIDGHSPLCTSGCLAPHLAGRDKIYLFPNVKDAVYIALTKKECSPWPLTKEEYKEKIKLYKHDPDFKIIFENDDLIILKKITQP
jgi:uncharacterized membrane protein